MWYGPKGHGAKAEMAEKTVNCSNLYCPSIYIRTYTHTYVCTYTQARGKVTGKECELCMMEMAI